MEMYVKQIKIMFIGKCIDIVVGIEYYQFSQPIIVNVPLFEKKVN